MRSAQTYGSWSACLSAKDNSPVAKVKCEKDSSRPDFPETSISQSAPWEGSQPRLSVLEETSLQRNIQNTKEGFSFHHRLAAWLPK